MMNVFKLMAVFLAVFVPFTGASAAAPPATPTICLDDMGCNPRGPNLEALSARFVGQGGDDSNDGKTHATRWATTSPARGLGTGTHVYLQAGFVQGAREWRINWGGTLASPAVIGCYYLDPAFDGQPTSCDQGSMGGRVSRPVLRGTYSADCRQSKPSTCPVDTAAAIPASKWNGLIDISASHVVVQDIEVRDSSGAGIRHNANFSHSDVAIRRVRVFQTYHPGIWLNKVPTNSRLEIRDSMVELVALKRVDGRENNWTGGIVIDSDGHAVNAVIDNNFLRDSGGEGIIALRIAGVIISNNIVANVRRVLIYLDNTSDSIIEHNMLLGNGFRNGEDESFGVAFGLAVEPYTRVYSSVRNIFRHNLIANTKGAINMSVFRQSSYNTSDINPAEEGYQVGVRIYGNTVLQNKREFLVGSHLTVNNNVDYVEISDNIIVGSTDCLWPSGLPESIVKITGNAFETMPSTSNCVGSNVSVRDPQIPLEYTSVHADNIPSPDQFVPSSGP